MAEAQGPPSSDKEEETAKAPKEVENLVVALRIRPINNDEIRDGATPIAHKVDENMVILLDPSEDPDDILRANRSREKQYVFDRSFDGAASQQEVYENTTKFLIPSVISGYNATVFAYGATGAGKTYTMLGTDAEPGIMVRTLNDLFQEMEKFKSENIYKVTLSYLEIYNEMIRDLLNPATGYLDLREDAKGAVGVAGLSSTSAKSASEIMTLLKRGNLERTQEPTAANKTSSRSHAVLQITVRQRTRVRDIRTSQRVGKLFLIDLAGSERAANTHNRGKRMVEGAHINRSLLALGNCINALSDKNGTKYVNYRDSKLTRLLKDALGGNCKTVMIAHLSPASIHFEESRNTLVYADRAKNIKTKVRKNVMDVTYHIAQYTNIIHELREEIARLRAKMGTQDSALVSRNSSAIHAIQSEVLAAGRREDQEEMDKFKDELLKVFREQMDYRRNLMEINQSAMEIELERSKHQYVIERWEAERTARLEDNKYGEEEKVEEPQEVKDARSEMMTLEEERDRNDRIKSRLQKELDNAKNKAAKVEEALPNKINSSEQQEVLGLMCKVHELEIDNMQTQSLCLVRDAQIKQQNISLERYRRHRDLCDEIIRQQRAILEEHKIVTSPELERLYRMYQQQVRERAHSPTERRISLPDINLYKNGLSVSISRRLLEADRMSDTERLSAVDEESTGDPAPKLFTASGKKSRKQILHRSAINMAKHGEQPEMTPRQKSIITLSSRSASSSPSAPPEPDVSRRDPVPRIASPVPESPVKDADRHVITSKTRSIAALAQQRKSKAHIDALNTERSSLAAPHHVTHHDTTSLSLVTSTTGNDVRASTDQSYKLTQSRLAQHDSRYAGSNVTLRHLVGGEEDAFSSPGTDSQSVGTTERAKNRALYRGGKPPGKTGRRKPRAPEYGASYQKLAKTSPRKNHHLNDSSNTSLGNVTRRGRLPVTKPNRSKLLMPSAEVDFDDEFDRFTPPPPLSVRQAGPEKGKGQTVQRKVKGPSHFNGSSDQSNSSTPQTRKSRKPPPTIPNYGKEAEISISGFGLGYK